MERKTKRLNDPLWYKDAIIYQLHVKSFFDGNNDGIGDFAGLTRKMGYLESLGVTAVWLLPFYPSPLRDDGYDTSDYMKINPAYGTMDEFKAFLEEAHRRAIRVITELVLNHTSDQHAWFRKSRTAKPGSYWRKFYVWSETNDRYPDARIIFKDFENSNWSWDPVARAYYWHRFYSHQPDLNFENPQVHRTLFRVIDFWLGMGIDGVRLDAVPYLYEQDGTNCENLPGTFDFLRKLRSHVEERFPDRMLLAEANQWPEDAVAYFGKGDMCHMAFHFPLMPRMYMALRMEDRFPIVDILEQTPDIPENAQWAIFLRNHDELTLEMVSEEERDFMYRSYARDVSARINLGIRRRLAPLMHKSRRRIELLNFLLLSLPGTPVIYYGDEIGMGDNHFLGDRNGVRTPMQWSPDRNAGFSAVNPQRLFLPVIIDPEYHYQAVNVETEELNPSSLLWWMRRTISMRRRFQAFSRGGMEMVKSNNASVLSFLRRFDRETILVVVNLSRFSESVSLDLGRFSGRVPTDVFSGNRFERIGNGPYQMTLGFHDYFWLELASEVSEGGERGSYRMPDFESGRALFEDFDGPTEKWLIKEALPQYLQQRATAGCRRKRIWKTEIVDHIPVRSEEFSAALLIVLVQYADGESDHIFLPLTIDTEEKASEVTAGDRELVFGFVKGGSEGVIYDCSCHPGFVKIMFRMMKRHRTFRGSRGALSGTSVLWKDGDTSLDVWPVRCVRSGAYNTCIDLGGKVFMKMYRRIHEGPHPEVELQKTVSGDAHGRVAADYFGEMTYRGKDGLYTVGMGAHFFPHSRTLWHTAVESASRHLESILIEKKASGGNVPPGERITRDLPGTPELKGSVVDFESVMAGIGEMTAVMHRRLAGEKGTDFATEPFTVLYQRSLYQTFRTLAHTVFSRIESKPEAFTREQAMEAQWLLQQKKEILAVFRDILQPRLNAVRMRIHGDYHLGQIMSGSDRYIICDFEGLATAPLSERRIKRSPLRDVASMVHSLFTAGHHALFNDHRIREWDRRSLLPCDQRWAARMSAVLVRSYFDAVRGTGLVSSSPGENSSLLRLYLVKCAMSELSNAIDGNHAMISSASRNFYYYLTMTEPLPA